MQLQGIDAVVTGGASGLGAATAKRLADGGARVLVVDQNETAAAAVATSIGGASASVDVADAAAVEAALADLPNLRVLVCCAGISAAKGVIGRNGPHPLELFEHVIRVNLTGTFNCVRLAAAKMAALDPLATVDGDDERGVIVMTASVAAFDGVDGGAAYSASKAGVAGMTLPMARDLGRYGIRVVSIAPGPFSTPMTADMPHGYDEKLKAEMPFPPRFGRPTEYASLVAHIVDNTMLNGEVIRIDAANRMAPSRLR